MAGTTSDTPNWTRLIRFIPKPLSSASAASSSPSSPPTPLIGQPLDPLLDVGAAAYASESIIVEVYSGKSILDAGEKTGEKREVERVLSPLGKGEVGTIRCIGLNYFKHAQEAGMDLPKVPVLFMKPSTALADPWPAKTILPKAFVKENAADYESELAVIISKPTLNVPPSLALSHILGFTASNDLSSRIQQFAQSQWSFSKSFDGACPIGPAVVSLREVLGEEGWEEMRKGEKEYEERVKEGGEEENWEGEGLEIGKKIGKMSIEGNLNGKVVQESGIDDLIFSIPKIISFLSQGTTLEPGTIILTGTPAGVGWSADPRRTLKDGDEFRIKVSDGVGTLINTIVEEK